MTGSEEAGDDVRNGDELESLIAHIETRLDSRFEFPDSKVDGGAATLGLLRIMLIHAHAIVAISNTPFAEAATANVRVMFEAWVEISTILEPGLEESNARRSVVFGLLEFRDHGDATGRLDEADFAKLDEVLRPYRTKYPELVADVEVQRTKKDPRSSQYWTGTSRSVLLAKMEQRGLASKLRSVYKMLSWDAHHVIAVALRSKIHANDDGSLETRFGILQPAGEYAEVNRFLAVQTLVKSWFAIATYLGVDPG